MTCPSIWVKTYLNTWNVTRSDQEEQVHISGTKWKWVLKNVK